MTDAEVERAIRAAGGGDIAVEDIDSLGVKIRRIAKSPKYSGFFHQFLRAKDAGDIRGRLLEINVLDHFLRHGVSPDHKFKQQNSGPGDIDFAWHLHGYQLCFEIKLLGRDKKSRDALNQQISISGEYTVQNDETDEIRRIQQAIISKSSTAKFNSKPAPGVINMIAIDVCELELNCVDMADCLLAAGGNPVVSQFYRSNCTRADVVGLFENIPSDKLTDAQRQWVNHIYKDEPNKPSPRTYIHGVLFLFRDRRDTAALSYELSSVIVWNPMIIKPQVAKELQLLLYGIIPREA